MGEIRTFESGATRDTDQGKLDFEGFLHPLCIEAFAEYMNKHRIQSDGSLRDSDNWQKGMPKSALVKSGWRHFFSWWKSHRGYATQEPIKDSLCALIFNAQGYLLEVIKEEREGLSNDFSSEEIEGITDALTGKGKESCIFYPCGCSSTGIGPLPETCPNHQSSGINSSGGSFEPPKPLTAWEKLQALASHLTGAA